MTHAPFWKCEKQRRDYMRMCGSRWGSGGCTHERKHIVRCLPIYAGLMERGGGTFLFSSTLKTSEDGVQMHHVSVEARQPHWSRVSLGRCHASPPLFLMVLSSVFVLVHHFSSTLLSNLSYALLWGLLSLQPTATSAIFKEQTGHNTPVKNPVVTAHGLLL